jgi:SH3 domain-containing YSC84-like protein 1
VHDRPKEKENCHAESNYCFKSWNAIRCMPEYIGAANASVQDDVDQAVTIIERFQAIPEKAIPDSVLRNAKGLAILTVTKAGFIGRGGSGIVVARTGNGWSGPSAIGTGGLGVGFQAGVEITEFVIVLTTQEAVDAFAKEGNVTLGANLSAAVGPVGRTAEANVAFQAAMYTYSISQGLFAGVSLEGAVIATRDDANAEYYGKAVAACKRYSCGQSKAAGRGADVANGAVELLAL